MAFKTTVSYELIRKIILVVFALPLVAPSNIDCGGRAFHCVNSTHFMICVDLGGGVSSTIDNFIIPCPPSTECQGSNHFECEFPRSTTVLPTTETSVPSELIQDSNNSLVTDSRIITATTNRVSEVQSSDTTLNTVSITTIPEDSATTGRFMTESIIVEINATADYTTIGYTLTTVPDEVTASTPSDVGYSVTESFPQIYQNTDAPLTISDVLNTNELIIQENIPTTYKPIPDKTMSESFITEKDTHTSNVFTSTDQSLLVDNNHIYIENASFGKKHIQNTTTEAVDTIVGTTTIDITNMDTVVTETFTGIFTTEPNQLDNDTVTGSLTYATQNLSEATYTENINVYDNFVTTQQVYQAIVDSVPVTEQYSTLPETFQNTLSTEIYPGLASNSGTTETTITDTIMSTTKDDQNLTYENIPTIGGTTYDTTTTNAITQEEYTGTTAETSIITNNINQNNNPVFTASTKTTISSVSTTEKVTTLSQNTDVFTLDKLTTAAIPTTDSNNMPEYETKTISVTEPSTNQFTSKKDQTTTPYTESSTIIVSLPSTGIFISNDDITSTAGLFVLNSNDINDLNILETSVITKLDSGTTINEDSTSMSSFDTERNEKFIQSTEVNIIEYSFTGANSFDEINSTMPLLQNSDVFDSVGVSTIADITTSFQDINTESTITDAIDNISTQKINVFDSTSDVTNTLPSTDSYFIEISSTSYINNDFEGNTVKNQPAITTVSNTATGNHETFNFSEFNHESTTIPTVIKIADSTVVSSYTHTQAINNFDGTYTVKQVTQETNVLEQEPRGRLSTTVTDKMHTKGHFAITEDNLAFSNNPYQIEKGAAKNPKKITSADSDSQNEYKIVHTVQSQLFYNQISSPASTTETAPTSMLLPAVSLAKDMTILNTQESITNNEILQPSAIEYGSSNVVTEQNFNNFKSQVGTNHDFDEFKPIYTFTTEGTDVYVNEYNGLETAKPSSGSITHTSDLHQGTSDQGFTQNIESKPSTVGTTQSTYGQEIEYLNILPQRTKHESSLNILSGIDFNENNRNVSEQLETDLLQDLPENTNSVNDSKNSGSNKENLNEIHNIENVTVLSVDTVKESTSENMKNINDNKQGLANKIDNVNKKLQVKDFENTNAKENVLEKTSSISTEPINKIVNKQNNEITNKDSSNLTYQSSRNEFSSSAIYADKYNQNNLTSLVDYEIAKDYLQKNKTPPYALVTVNKSDSMANNVNSRTAAAAAATFKNSDTKHTSTTDVMIQTTVYSDITKATLPTITDSLVETTVLDRELGQNSKTSTIISDSLVGATLHNQRLNQNEEPSAKNIDSLVEATILSQQLRQNSEIKINDPLIETKILDQQLRQNTESSTNIRDSLVGTLRQIGQNADTSTNISDALVKTTILHEQLRQNSETVLEQQLSQNAEASTNNYAADDMTRTTVYSDTMKDTLPAITDLLFETTVLDQQLGQNLKTSTTIGNGLVGTTVQNQKLSQNEEPGVINSDGLVRAKVHDQQFSQHSKTVFNQQLSQNAEASIIMSDALERTTELNQQLSQNARTVAKNSDSFVEILVNDQQLNHNAESSTKSSIATNHFYPANQPPGLDHNTEPSVLRNIPGTFDKTVTSKQSFSTSITDAPNSSFVKHLKADKTIHQNAAVNETSVNLQVPSVPNESIVRQSLVLEHRSNQKTEVKETNTVNKISGTDTTIETDKYAKDTKAAQIPNDSSLKYPLTYDDKSIQNAGSSFGTSHFNYKENNNVTDRILLSSDSVLSVLLIDKVRLGNVAEKHKTLLNHARNTAVHTTLEVTTTIPTESTVKYTTPNTDLTNILNGQKVIDPFCLTRNRGRYADRQDCTKFYICIGKTNPIVGKCPVNTVFSEIKKQCTKNKSHCVRGNEFQCISEGRFSDILKNNAYYICIRRQNSFIRFKFQCQNGYYFNKITVRCTKQLEAINPSSSSLDNSEKNVSKGTSSKESKKRRQNNKDDKKEDKSGEEFECKKEGKFADPDNCRKFYVCNKTKKSEFRMRRKSCDSDELFHKDKKKCVDADSYEC